MPELGHTVKLIVATANDAVFAALSAVPQFDAQHQVHSVTQMWQELSDGTLDPSAPIVIIGGDLPEGDAVIAAALAATPDGARIFYIESRPAAWDEVQPLILRNSALPEKTATIGVLAAEPRVLTAQLMLVLGLNQVAPVAPPEPQYAPPAYVAPAPMDVDPFEVAPQYLPPGTIAPVYVAPTEYAPEPEVSTYPNYEIPPPAAPREPLHAASEPDVFSDPVIHATAPPAQRSVPRPPIGVRVPLIDIEPVASVSNNFSPDLVNAPDRPYQETVVVVSSKGGSGKSTSAVALAAAIRKGSKLAVAQGLATEALSVCIIDMDVRDGQLATFVGVYNPTALSIRKMAFVDEQVVRDNIVHAPQIDVDVLLAPSRPRTADDCGPVFYRSLIRAVKKLYDIVILDGSVNYLDPLLGGVCMPEATKIMLITTPFRTSVHGVARAVAEMTDKVENGGLGVPRSKIGLVVNQASTDGTTNLREIVAATQQIEVVGQIPCAPYSVMLEATNSARMDLLLEDGDVGPAYFELAKRIVSPAQIVIPEISAQPTNPTRAGAPVRPVTPVAAPAPVQQMPVPVAPNGVATPGRVMPVVAGSGAPLANPYGQNPQPVASRRLFKGKKKSE